MYAESTRKASINRDVYEHEIYLSFITDSGAYAFHNWWETIGKKAFEEWAEENKESFF